MSVKFKGKTRRVYGKPMSKYAGNGAGFDIPNEVMEEIAKVKMKDMNAADLDGAVRIIAGSARSMGIIVEGV